jgi:hypothetical protein
MSTHKTQPPASFGAAAGSPLSPDWDSINWRDLRKGEIIEAGDWVDACNDGWRDPPKWKPANCVGEPAPDPQYPAHRNYRRILPNAKVRDGE